MTGTATTDPAPTGADLDDTVRALQSAVWTLASARDVGLDRARRIRHAARLVSAAADRLLLDAAGEAADPAPPGLAGLVSALVTLDGLAAVDRGRLTPDVMTLARAVLRRERGRAMAETGLSTTALSREYGVSPATVRAALGDARGTLPDVDLDPPGSAESRTAARAGSGSEPMRAAGPIRDASAP